VLRSAVPFARLVVWLAIHAIAGLVVVFGPYSEAGDGFAN
jgi:hypothetical protein